MRRMLIGAYCTAIFLFVLWLVGLFLSFSIGNNRLLAITGDGEFVLVGIPRWNRAGQSLGGFRVNRSQGRIGLTWPSLELPARDAEFLIDDPGYSRQRILELIDLEFGPKPLLRGWQWRITAPLLPLALLAVLFALWIHKRHRRRARPWYCPLCEYSLLGNVSGICPECGTKILGRQRADIAQGNRNGGTTD